MSGIDSIINTAKSYLGTYEGSNNHKEIIDLYNKARYSDAYCMTMNDPWCCAFVVAIFQQCGMSDIIPCYAACDQMISTFKQWGRYESRNAHKVKAGDIIFYDWGGDASSDHVGIVVQNQMGKLSIIEGNKTDSVAYRTIDSSNSCIIGYGIPNYGASGEEIKDDVSNIDNEYIKSLPILMYGSDGLYVKILQILLNYYDKSKLDIDGEFGPKTKSAVSNYQTKHNLKVDGIAGKEVWTHLLVKQK